MLAMLRTSLRTVKRPLVFHWSPSGRSYPVDPKEINLPKKIGNFRHHTTPPAVVKQSTAPRAGYGVFVLMQLVAKNMILGEYNGPTIDIEDALDLESRVCSLFIQPVALFDFLKSVKISNTLVDCIFPNALSYFSRGWPRTSSVSIATGALTPRSFPVIPWSPVCRWLRKRLANRDLLAQGSTAQEITRIDPEAIQKYQNQ